VGVERLALAGYVACIAASFAVGGRLLLLWRRTGQTPELAIGVALFAGGGLGYGLAMAAYALRVFPSPWAAGAETLGAFASHVGAASLALALRHIFRPDAAWARTLQLSLTVAIALAFAARFVEPLAFPPPGFVFWPYVLLGAACYAWSCIESLHYHAMMRRRMRIGLAEPLLARRFLLWGIAGLAAVGMHVAAMASRLAYAGAMPTWMLGLVTALGLVAAAGIWLAFFPRRRERPPAPAVT
jgi:hypothetical protein